MSAHGPHVPCAWRARTSYAKASARLQSGHAEAGHGTWTRWLCPGIVNSEIILFLSELFGDAPGLARPSIRGNDGRCNVLEQTRRRRSAKAARSSVGQAGLVLLRLYQASIKTKQKCYMMPSRDGFICAGRRPWPVPSTCGAGFAGTASKDLMQEVGR